MIFLKKGARVELYLARRDRLENKWIFDHLESEKEEIEGRFGEELQWQRLNDKKASRICHSILLDGFAEENWPKMIDWLCHYIVKLERAFSEPLAGLNQQLTSQSVVPVGDSGGE